MALTKVSSALFEGDSPTFTELATLTGTTPQLDFKQTSGAHILASVRAEVDSGTGGKLVISTKRDGDSAVDRLTIDDDGASTFSGSVTATSLDISGNIDVDGTTNLDVVDIDGAVDMASTLQVDGALTVSGATNALSPIQVRNATQSFNGGLSAEVNTSILNFGLNEGSGNRFGGSYTQASQGGMLHFDTRSGEPLFQIYGREAGTANASGTAVLNITSAGAATFASTIAATSATVDDYVIHNGNTTTKLGFGSANTMNFISNGSDRLTIANSYAVFNNAGTDYDFTIKSNGNNNMLHVDGGNNSVGIGTTGGTTGSLIVQSNSGAGGIAVIGRSNGGIGGISLYDDNGSTSVGYIQGRADDKQMRFWGTQADGNLSFATNNTERMKIHGTGEVTKPYQPAFMATRSGTETGYNASGNYADVVTYNNSVYNIGNHYDTGTGYFTAPVAGVYYFSASAYMAFACGQCWFSSSAGRINQTDIVMNGMAQFPSGWCLLKLAANDTVGFHPYAESTTNGTLYANANHTYFTGVLLG